MTSRPVAAGIERCADAIAGTEEPSTSSSPSRGRMVMQLHAWEAYEHPHMGKPETKPYGNGVLLWFQTDFFKEAVQSEHES